MKKTSTVFLASLAAMVSFIATSCNGGGGGTTPETFSFSLSLSTGQTGKLYVGDNPQIIITPLVKDDKVQRVYTFKSSDDATISVDDEGNLKALKPTVDDKKVTIKVTETVSQAYGILKYTVEEASELANTGYNFSSSNTDKTEIIGKLEEYAMKSFLTGMPLFENGGYVRYAPRVELPVKEYITGYGFGVLREGKLTSSNTKVSSAYKDFLLSSMTSDPSTVNAWMAQGSQVSDLNSYITSSYWGTKLNDARTGYEWYPVLALNKEPIAQYEEGHESDKGLYNTWRVYVRTGVDKSGNIIRKEDGGVFYDTKSSKYSAYKGRPIRIEDYEFVFKLLLTQDAKLIRGTELATDTSYGFKGANQYYRQSTGKTQEEMDELWESFTKKDNFGIKTGYDDSRNQYYIDFSFINPIDEFTAKYTLSSNLYSPLPQEYLEDLAKEVGISSTYGWIKAGQKYGTVSSSSIVDHVLSVGPYSLQTWYENDVVFVRHDDTVEGKGDGWYEIDSKTYRIPGVYITVVDASENEDAVYNLFNTGKLDSCGLNKNHINEVGKTANQDKQTVGDSTFKLNINSCTQDRWDYLFGENGKIKQGGSYVTKSWMSNINFLKGLFFSIDRKQFAHDRGVNPSVNYFADTYQSDPTNEDATKRSYNNTDAHKKALRGFGIDPNDTTYGYKPDVAINYFKTAYNEFKGDLSKYGIRIGTADNPSYITIDIWWMSNTDPREYGNDIAYYFETAFNDPSVNGGCVKLKVNNLAVSQWEKVYEEHLQIGQFDLGFGAISGNALNPLNFLEVLKSDNSSGFTLNWGADTGIVDPANPISFKGKTWSFDALWAAGDHGTIVQQGEEVEPINRSYLVPPTSDTEETLPLPGGDLRNGGYVNVPTFFANVDLEGVTFAIEKAVIYVSGSEGVTVTGDDLRKVFDSQGRLCEIQLHISKETAEQINESLAGTKSVASKIRDLAKTYPNYNNPESPRYESDKAQYEAKYDEYTHLFTYGNYGMYWAVEVHYIMSIEGASPIQNYVYSDKSESDVETKSRGAYFARA